MIMLYVSVSLLFLICGLISLSMVPYSIVRKLEKLIIEENKLSN